MKTITIVLPNGETETTDVSDQDEFSIVLEGFDARCLVNHATGRSVFVFAKLDDGASYSYKLKTGQPPLPTSQPAHQSGALSDVLKDMSISLHTIKETLPSVLSGHVVTPSTASRDRQRSASIFDAVGLALKPTELDGEYVLPVEHQNRTDWKFDFKWPVQSLDDKVLERTSYAPVLKYLRGLDLLAEDENPNDVRGQKVYHRHRVQGRTDLVVLNKSRQGGEILRSMVRIAIEIKTTNGYKQSVDGCMGEAQLQLIGLNAFNTNHTPPVLLSNLAKTHFVLYLDYSDDGWSYVIKKRLCATFSAALHFALEKSNEDSISANFSRPMTPESSD
eukprot:CAMPEP_0168764528 /NCGR_PEP_ID=MMETSP0724-20121128/24918_1 /TAXON_ID=265536 /ORGANISM="Amphiprora sp., Strain CCMP467" /LENGTH=332 /DNA_ID=CAMNT_0008813751 /DNA_START=45 /DNA_END=1043 /DNA_ORIENTATION=+